MDAKSLLLRARLRAVTRRLLLASLLAWGVFGWLSGRIDIVGGTQNVIAYVHGKIGPKDRLAGETSVPTQLPQDVVAARAATAARAAGLAPAPKPADQPLSYPPNEVLCLAHAVYFEAGREQLDIQSAVAQVAINRVRSMQGPKSICRIVYLGLGRPMGCLFRNTCRNLGVIPDDEAAWKNALQVAHQVAQRQPAGEDRSELAAATHFHTTGLRPGWVRQVYRLAQKGKFVFYASEPVETAGAEAAELAGPRGIAPGKPRSVAVTATTEGDGMPLIRRKTAATSTAAATSAVESKARARATADSRDPVRSPFGDQF